MWNLAYRLAHCGEHRNYQAIEWQLQAYGYPQARQLFLPFDEWTSVFGSERLTGALLDRLTHHVHILQMNGDSYRLNQSKRRSRGASSDTSVDNPTQA